MLYWLHCLADSYFEVAARNDLMSCDLYLPPKDVHYISYKYETVIFSCSLGYHIVGSDQSKCVNGEWTEVITPRCKCKMALISISSYL